MQAARNSNFFTIFSKEIFSRKFMYSFDETLNPTIRKFSDELKFGGRALVTYLLCQP